jgi:hypothetical protein
MCVKNIITCSELCVDVDFEMIAFELKGMFAKCTWKFLDIYRATKDDCWRLKDQQPVPDLREI